MGAEYAIKTTWDGNIVDHSVVKLCIQPDIDCVKIQIDAPFFNDPQSPTGKAGEPCPELWEYEVVEAFFLNDQDQYLEVELCPHGQHLVLLLKSRRDCFKEQLQLKFNSHITGNRWQGEAVIPAEYFPARVNRFNAYAIHGSGDNRVYEALYPVPNGKYTQPDFHRLEYFQPFDVSLLDPSNHTAQYKSTHWQALD